MGKVIEFKRKSVYRSEIEHTLISALEKAGFCSATARQAILEIDTQISQVESIKGFELTLNLSPNDQLSRESVELVRSQISAGLAPYMTRVARLHLDMLCALAKRCAQDIGRAPC